MKRFAVQAGNLVDRVEDQFGLVVANLLPESLAIYNFKLDILSC